MTIAVNIDWDFFFKEEEDWDWGHREALIFLELMWYHRFESFALSPRLGQQDLEQFYQPSPLYKHFKTKLEALGFDFSNAVLVVGDSNLGAWSTFSSLPVTYVYNFDYHHDVAYHDLNTQVDCGNWLGQLLRKKKQLSATVVYPTQERLKREFKFPLKGRTANMIEGWLMKSRLGSKAIKTLEPKKRKVSFLFICRSGCWTPPWADTKFLELVNGFSEHPIWYVDLLSDKSADLANPLVARNWDREEALRQTEEFREQIEKRRSVNA